MDDKKARIIEMIIKASALTAKDSGAFEGEISAASAKVQELMDKYSITWAEVNASKADQQEKEFNAAFESRSSEFKHNMIAEWQWQLARLVGRVTHTRHFATGGRMTFFGIDANAEVASSLYALWVVQIDEMSKHALKKYRAWLVKELYTGQKNFYSELPENLKTKYYRASWLKGCLRAMNKNVDLQEEQRSKENSNAIVLYKEEVDKRYKVLSTNFRNVSPKGSRGFSNVGYSAGSDAGSSILIGSKPLKPGK